MTQCEKCGNSSAESFQITLAGQSHVFDSFECAISALAPICAHCGCRIIGHGVKRAEILYCCDHCAQAIHTTAAS